MGTPANYSLVQTVNPAVSTGTITATPAITKVGSLVLVFIGCSALTDTVSTVTDNAGNVYTKAYGIATGTGGNTELWYCGNSKPTSSVVVTFSAAVSTKSVFVREYSGMLKANVLDTTITASGSGTSVTSGASTSTRGTDELIVSSCSCLGTNPTLSVGAGFGNFTSQTVIAAASTHGIQDLTVSALGAQTGLMTAGGTLPVWDVGTAAFFISRGEGDTLFRHVNSGEMSRNEVAN